MKMYKIKFLIIKILVGLKIISIKKGYDLAARIFLKNAKTEKQLNFLEETLENFKEED